MYQKRAQRQSLHFVTKNGIVLHVSTDPGPSFGCLCTLLERDLTSQGEQRIRPNRSQDRYEIRNYEGKYPPEKGQAVDDIEGGECTIHSVNGRTWSKLNALEQRRSLLTQ